MGRRNGTRLIGSRSTLGPPGLRGCQLVPKSTCVHSRPATPKSSPRAVLMTSSVARRTGPSACLRVSTELFRTSSSRSHRRASFVWARSSTGNSLATSTSGSQPRRRELGFVIGERRHWRQGLGRAAAEAGLRFGFASLGLSQIWAEALDANRASVRISPGAWDARDRRRPERNLHGRVNLIPPVHAQLHRVQRFLSRPHKPRPTGHVSAGAQPAEAPRVIRSASWVVWIVETSPRPGSDVAPRLNSPPLGRRCVHIAPARVDDIEGPETPSDEEWVGEAVDERRPKECPTPPRSSAQLKGSRATRRNRVPALKVHRATVACTFGAREPFRRRHPASDNER